MIYIILIAVVIYIGYVIKKFIDVKKNKIKKDVNKEKIVDDVTQRVEAEKDKK